MEKCRNGLFFFIYHLIYSFYEFDCIVKLTLKMDRVMQSDRP